jgi:hypothetical protein
MNKNDIATLREALEIAADVIGSSEPFAKAFSILNAAEKAREDMIKEAVTNFLGWKLPADFAPDANISFKRAVLPSTPQTPGGYWPIGTNLFSDDQAEQMFRHCLPTILDRLEAQESREGEAVGYVAESTIRSLASHREIRATIRPDLHPDSLCGQISEGQTDIFSIPLYTSKQALSAETDALQAKIDALMLEFCPAEMTPEQVARWEASQVQIKICANCDTALPEGCRGIFKDEGATCALNRQPSNPTKQSGEQG